MNSAEAVEVKTSRDKLPAIALGALIGIYIAVFGWLTWRQQSHFGTFGFDMGIYDQGIWLVSRFKEPFVTVRGLNYFGHHVNLITLVLVPFYWLGAGPHFLYLFETFAMAAGAIPIWLLTSDKTGNRWAALVPAGAYLLYPALEWINWWHFHPDALIITPLLFAWWLASRKKWRWFVVALVCALLAKEDAALAVIVMGVVMAIRGERKWGGRTVIAGAAWFLICTRIIIPIANNGGSPFYEEFFPDFGHSMFAIAWTMIRHPSRIYRVAFLADRMTYYRQLLIPVALMPFAAPLLLAVGGPQILVNVVSLHSPTHDIHYHYSSIPIVAIFLATVEVYALLVRRGGWVRGLAVGVLIVSSVGSNIAWSPSPIGRAYDDGYWVASYPRHAAVKAALKLVNPSDAVTATHYIVPHLTHRVQIYEFPNPFVVANWGANGENPPDPKSSDVLVLDTTVNGGSDELYERLVAPTGPYRIVFERDEVVVARRKSGR